MFTQGSTCLGSRVTHLLKGKQTERGRDRNLSDALQKQQSSFGNACYCQQLQCFFPFQRKTHTKTILHCMFHMSVHSQTQLLQCLWRFWREKSTICLPPHLFVQQWHIWTLYLPFLSSRKLNRKVNGTVPWIPLKKHDVNRPLSRSIFL